MTLTVKLLLYSLAAAVTGSCAAGQSATTLCAPGFKRVLAPSATLTVSGHPGQIPMVQINGRSYIDVEALARLAEGSITYRTGGVVLTLTQPKPADVPAPVVKPKPGFSQGFLTAEIEEMTVVREWRIALVNAVQTTIPSMRTGCRNIAGTPTAALR